MSKPFEEQYEDVLQNILAALLVDAAQLHVETVLQKELTERLGEEEQTTQRV